MSETICLSINIFVFGYLMAGMVGGFVLAEWVGKRGDVQKFLGDIQMSQLTFRLIFLFGFMMVWLPAIVYDMFCCRFTKE